MAQIDWEAFHEGLGLVNQAIGPWRALARLEEVLQYGTMLREQVLLAETQLNDTLRELDNKRKALIEADEAVAAVKTDLALLKLNQESEKNRLDDVWAELNKKHKTAYEQEVEQAKKELQQFKKECAEEKAKLQKEEAEKRALVQELDKSIILLRDRIKGLG